MDTKTVLFMRLKTGQWVGFKTARKRKAAAVLKTFNNKIGIGAWMLEKSGDIQRAYPQVTMNDVILLN